MTFDVKLPDGIIQSIQITAEVFKTFSVWRIQGKEAILYHVGDEWLQRNEDGLSPYLLQLIGRCIDGFAESGLKNI